MEGRRTTYEELAANVNWGHQYGRGLGKHLYAVLDFCHQSGLPLLTMIVVYKGQLDPSDAAINELYRVRGNRNIREEQDRVFSYDWSSVAELNEKLPQNVLEREVWLTSFWGFYPQEWGCLGFSSEGYRNRFLRETKPGALVAIYVTQSSPEKEMRGKVVGFLEVSHEKGDIQEFLSPSEYEAKQGEPYSEGRWSYALRVTRAWQIAPEEWKSVEELFPDTFSTSQARVIGAQGVRVANEEVKTFSQLTVHELSVFGQKEQPLAELGPLQKALTPSSAVMPARNPYIVTETDGPKHLYIMRLTGDLSVYLGKDLSDQEDLMIVKVGFSKSPLTRRNQIQNSYPDGTYKWEIIFPSDVYSEPPYPNAEVAIKGEDAMKSQLIKRGSTSLGGEFFLAHENDVHKVWHHGNFVSKEFLSEVENDSA